METNLYDRAYDVQCIVKGVQDIIVAGVFDLGDSPNAGFVILKALDFADESLQEVLSIAEGKSDELLAYCALDRWRFHDVSIGVPHFADGSFHDTPITNALCEDVDFLGYLSHQLIARSESTNPLSKHFSKALPMLPMEVLQAAMQLLWACEGAPAQT